MVKPLPALWDTWVQSQGWEDPLENGIATHSSILAWRRIPWTEEPGRYSPYFRYIIINILPQLISSAYFYFLNVAIRKNFNCICGSHYISTGQQFTKTKTFNRRISFQKKVHSFPFTQYGDGRQKGKACVFGDRGKGRKARLGGF